MMASSVISIPKKLPLLVIGNDVLLPGLSMRIPVSTPRNMTMVRQHLMKYNTLTSAIIGVIPKKPDIGSNEITQESDLHSVGSAAVVVQITETNWPQPSYTLLVTGLCRFKLTKLIQHYPYPVGLVEQLDKLPSTEDAGTEEPNEELLSIIDKFKSKAFALLELLDISLPISLRLKKILNSVPTHSLADVCASIIKASYSEKLEILDAVDLSERFEKMLPLLQRQIDALQVIPRSKKSTLDKSLPFKQMTKRSLDDSNDDGDLEIDDIADLENKLNAAKLPPHAHKVAMKELQRLKKMMPQLPEHSLTRTYLELMSELPWSKSSTQTLDINKARKDMDADHYAMEKVKKRILEYLAVCQLKSSLRGPILCFTGPPGVGKTSIGRSIANTLGREFHRIALGGVCDQSDIRGHRRTYIGALPGRIIQGLRQVGVNNPVFLLDEIDKLSAGIHGNPAAALLEVLDPAQNFSFTDHYLNVPFDLSQVLFIATANTIASIPPALLDRMEVIPVAGYMQEEKVHIALRHLIPKQIKENGLSEDILTITEDSVKALASRYTREAGVRSLERKIGAICRAVAVRIAEGNQEKREGNEDIAKHKKSKKMVSPHPPELPIVIDEQAVEDILGPPVYENEICGRLGQPGVAIGLAWTPLGGKILFIEATIVDGDGDLILTGQLGDVMKESAKIALNWVRSQAEMWANNSEFMKSKDVHIHFPSGAVGKDGPSAGITIVTVLVSLFSGRCVRSDLAMTGEVTLRGLVLPVGGIKEKVLAAHRAGITTILLPHQNRKDLHDIPANIQSEVTFIFIKTVEEALQNAFEGGINVSESQIESVIPSNL